jgi:hypothetical protein
MEHFIRHGPYTQQARKYNHKIPLFGRKHGTKKDMGFAVENQ